uniref:Uncharacterized protein n=1 Tax=Cannabis sativa TaxID=3483 RepID=A0A803Q5M4_CANSA
MTEIDPFKSHRAWSRKAEQGEDQTFRSMAHGGNMGGSKTSKPNWVPPPITAKTCRMGLSDSTGPCIRAWLGTYVPLACMACMILSFIWAWYSKPLKWLCMARIKFLSSHAWMGFKFRN